MLRPSLRLLCPCNARCPYDVTAFRDQHPRSSATSEFPRNHTRHRFRWMLHPYGDNVFNFRIQMSSTRRRIDLLLLLPRFCKTAYWMSFSLWFSKWLFIGFSAEFLMSRRCSCNFCKNIIKSEILSSNGNDSHKVVQEARCTDRNLIYGIKCVKCNYAIYVGETERTLKERVSEHLHDI